MWGQEEVGGCVDKRRCEGVGTRGGVRVCGQEEV